MLKYWTIYFRCKDEIKYNLDNAKCIHGFLFKVLQEYDSGLATIYHDKSANQSFTISTIFDGEDKRKKIFKGNSLLKFHISLYDEETNSAFLRFIRKNNKIQFNSKELLIEKVCCENIDFEFLERNKISKATIKFITPTTFRVNPSNFPLPEPRKIFKSLNRNYKDIFNEELLNSENLDEVNKYVAVEGLDINTEIAEYKKYKFLGFTGMVILKIKFPNEDIQNKLEKLMALIPYVGIGYKTGMGMGKCVIIRT